jgi:hypothetical protein
MRQRDDLDFPTANAVHDLIGKIWEKETPGLVWARRPSFRELNDFRPGMLNRKQKPLGKRF